MLYSFRRMLSILSSRVTTIFLCLVISVSLSGQTIVQMEVDGGIYKVPCSVNGVKMKFVFDTGASTVALSSSIASYLLDCGALKQGDFVGNGSNLLADGSVVDVQLVNLRDFEIGGVHIKDVLATIKDGQNVPLLLGQSAIEKLGRVSIDGNRLIIHQFTVHLTEDEIDQLRVDAHKLLEEGMFENAREKLERVRQATAFDYFDYNDYAYCLSQLGEDDLVLNIVTDWENDCLFSTPSVIKEFMYSLKAHSLQSQNKYKEAISAFQEAYQHSSDGYKAEYLSQIGRCYFELGSKYDSEQYLYRSLDLRFQELSITLQDVVQNKVEDETLGYLYWNLFNYELYLNNNIEKAQQFLRFGAKCGNPTCIKYCFKHGLNYRDTSF